MKVYVIMPNASINCKDLIYVGKEKDAKKICSMVSGAYYETIQILNSVEVEEICRNFR